MGLQDRDYYWERQKSAQQKKPSRMRRLFKPVTSANQPPDLMESLARIPIFKLFWILVLMGLAGYFLYPM